MILIVHFPTPKVHPNFLKLVSFDLIEFLKRIFFNIQ